MTTGKGDTTALGGDRIDCDVLVVGSGAGGFSTAIVARAHGLDVVVVEKEPVFGGTTALSGGALWIPGNPLAKARGVQDTRLDAERYMRQQTGAHFDADAVRVFLDNGPEMVDWFEKNTQVRFMFSMLPDYHAETPGGVDVGRSIMARPFDSRALGKDMARLRRPLRTITFLGMMFNSSNEDLKHFFRATKSFASFVYVVRRLIANSVEMLRHGRAVNVTTGNALIARLAKSVLDLGIPILTSSPVKSLSREGDRIVGAVVERDGRPVAIRARRGVVLACGGFPHDEARKAALYPHVRRGGVHLSPAPAGNTGDGLRLAEGVGARVGTAFENAAAWIPVSRVPLGGGQSSVFPHLQDRYKPGLIAVRNDGKRFCNESLSYHDMGEAMIAACKDDGETGAWLLCDHVAIRKYGLGFAKPAPVPLSPYLRSGYLVRARTIVELAARIGVPADALAETVRGYNTAAASGSDPAFARGSTVFSRYLGDPAQGPNPCIAPMDRGPYYAVKLLMGDLGTFDGLVTAADGGVLDGRGLPIPGLYAVGNDRLSVMGGNYPGAGITLGPAMTFGFVTGRALAAPPLAGAPPLADPPALERRLVQTQAH